MKRNRAVGRNKHREIEQKKGKSTGTETHSERSTATREREGELKIEQRGKLTKLEHKSQHEIEPSNPDSVTSINGKE